MYGALVRSLAITRPSDLSFISANPRALLGGSMLSSIEAFQFLLDEPLLFVFENRSRIIKSYAGELAVVESQ